MKKIICGILLIVVLTFQVFAVSGSEINTIGSFILDTVTEPSVGSVGGEWSVLGLSRSGIEVPGVYYENYYDRVEEYVKNKNGVLSKNKYTEYSRVVIALCAIGKDPTNVGGYNLITPLLDYDSVIKQGINGPSWALIALDAAEQDNDEIRTKYIDLILSRQLSSGGWALNSSVKEADVDITAMVLTALSSYTDNSTVKQAVDKGLSYLSGIQKSDGSFYCVYA